MTMNGFPGGSALTLFALLSSGCFFATTNSVVVPIPPGVWTTRPVPCDYEEVAVVWVRGVDVAQTSKQLFRWFYASAADALIDYDATTRVASGIAFHTVSGLAVSWVGEGCPSRPRTFKEAMEARRGLPDIEKFGPPKRRSTRLSPAGRKPKRTTQDTGGY